MEMERKDKCDGRLTLSQLNDTNSQSQEICYCQRVSVYSLNSY